MACSVAGALAPAAERAGLAVRPLLSRRVKRRLSLPYAWKLARFVRREAFDLVHAHIYASAAASALATVGTRVPLVLTEHTEAGWRTRRARWFSRYIYRRAAHVIAVSDAIHRRLIDVDGVPPTRITVIRNALPPMPELAPPSQPTPSQASPLLTGDRAGPTVGVIARLQPEKGVAYFLQAAAQVAQSAPEARFVIVGDGPLRQDLASLRDHLGLRERVQFLGLRVDAPALVAGLDVLVVPSLPSLSGEGTPLVILEAMAAGVPIVASAVGGIPEQIGHEREGLLVPPGDPEALSAAILSLLQDPAWARRLGEAGRRRLATRFNPVTMLRQTECIYRAALAGAEA